MHSQSGPMHRTGIDAGAQVAQYHGLNRHYQLGSLAQLASPPRSSKFDACLDVAMPPRRKPLHVLQLVAGLAMFPLAGWLYLRADYLGVAFAVTVGLLAVAYTTINLFVRQWP
jgi:hypothetical protein